jgi:hypothetical protein
MRTVMFKLSTASSAHTGESKKLEQSVRHAAEETGGRLVCYSGNGGVAYGIFENPGDLEATLRTLAILEAIGEIIASLIPD